MLTKKIKRNTLSNWKPIQVLETVGNERYYYLDLYGSQLWEHSKNDVNAFYIAWRKVVRETWKIPSITHCNLLISLCLLSF